MARAAELCGECGLRPPAPGQYKCKECHAAYMRQWRAKLISVRLDDSLYERMRQRSGRTRQSYSQIITEALELLLEDGSAA